VSLKKNDNVIFYVTPGSKVANDLKKYFFTIQELDWPSINVIEKHLQNKKFYLAKKFKLDGQKL
jgi:hypothetical protein